jgi:hypothetical protein
VSKTELVSVAAQVLANEMDPLEGCRWIVRHQSALSEEERLDPSFVRLVGIESETDQFAMGVARQNWDAQALAEQDVRRAEYLRRVQLDLLEACRLIIEKFST